MRTKQFASGWDGVLFIIAALVLVASTVSGLVAISQHNDATELAAVAASGAWGNIVLQLWKSAK